MRPRPDVRVSTIETLVPVAMADFRECSMRGREERSACVRLLFDPARSLEERFIVEQFPI